MKKILCLFLVFCLCFSMAGCGGEPESTENTEPKKSTLTEENAMEAAAELLKTMTLEEKIGQLLIVDADKLVNDKKPVQEAVPELLEALDKYKVGGLVFYDQNIKGVAQIQTMLGQIRELTEASPQTRIPLYLATQEEGGGTNSIAAQNDEIKSTGYISPSEMGKNMTVEQLEDTGEIIGEELLNLGFNMNFAPMADVVEEEKNIDTSAVDETVVSVLGKEPEYIPPAKKISKAKRKKKRRAYKKKLQAYQNKYESYVESYCEEKYSESCFGADEEKTGEAAAAMVKGMHASYTGDGGRLCTVLKMFPGICSVAKYHKLAPVGIDTGLSRLRRVNFEPFDAGISAGTDVVMVSHVSLTKVDPQVPSSMSRVIISDVLRKELGFQGIIMTEQMDLPVITTRYTTSEAVVKAVASGADMIYNPESIGEAVSALCRAVETEEIDEKVIDQAVLRILQNKIFRGICPLPDQ